MTHASKRGIFPRFFSFILLTSMVLALCTDYPGSIFIYTDRHVFAGRLSVGGSFWHVYIHSINKTPVREKIAIHDGEFVITEGWFKDYSTGIDSGTGTGFREEQGWFILTLNRHVPELRIAVSPIPGHALEAGGQVYPLTHWTKRGEILLLTTKLF